MNNLLSGIAGRDFEVFSCIQKNGPITKSALTQKLNCKLTTLNRSMKLLESRKLIAESGISASTGGRKPSKYDVTEQNIYTIGVDISRTYVKTAVMTLKLRILEQEQFEMDDPVTPQICVDRIAGMIRRMTAGLAITNERVLGIGVGTVGPMDRKSGILLHPQGFPNGMWNDDIPLKQLLQEATGMRCAVDNGANTAALAEFHFGAGRGYRNLAYIHCGIGIRSAVIQDGMLIRTMNDTEDALAHMTIDFKGKSCGCGGSGCLESYVSLPSVLSQYISATGETIDYRELFARAAEGDRAAADAFCKSAETLGVGISNLSRIVSPDLIILSGPLIANYAPYFSVCVKTFRERNFHNEGPVFSKQGSFKKDVVAIGSGLMLLEQLINQRG